MDQVTICNMALNSIGHKAIASLEDEVDNSDEAAICATFFDPSVRAVFEDGAPLFATDLFDLGARQDSAYSVLGGEHTLIAKFAFTGPNDVDGNPTILVRPLSCDDGSGDFTIRWERAGLGFILSEDTDKLFCRAVQLVLDPNKWTPGYVWAVAYKLAAVIAGPLTNSAKLETDMLTKYAEQMKTAKNLDGMAGTSNQQIKIKSTSLSNLRR